MSEPILTVFTPTYNRADLLERCYQSVLRQTNKNFKWMIIDDGSTDNTAEVVKEWIESSRDDVEIIYIYKTNGGLHTAYNEAIAHIDTELCVCIDSDDFMPDNAIELILEFWKKNGSNEYAGIVGLDYDLDNQVIGDKLPDIKSVNLIGLLLDKYGIKNGDRTNVVRTELYKKFAPMKVFPGEKNFNPHYMHLQISLEYDFLVLNENLRYVDYQDSGMTNSMLWQYYNSPNSFAEIRKLYLSLPGTSFPFRVKNTIHLISSYILAKKASSAVRENPYHLLTIFMFPVGFVFSLYIKIKNRNV